MFYLQDFLFLLDFKMVLVLLLFLFLIIVNVIKYKDYCMGCWYFYKKELKLFDFIRNLNFIFNLILLQEILRKAKGSNIKHLLGYGDIHEALQHIEVFLKLKQKNILNIYYMAPPHQGYDASSFFYHDFELIQQRARVDLLTLYDYKMRTRSNLSTTNLQSFVKDYSSLDLGENLQGCRPKALDYLEIGLWKTEDFTRMTRHHDVRLYNQPKINFTNQASWFEELDRKECGSLTENTIISQQGLNKAQEFHTSSGCYNFI